jgi:hypothetical protein
MYHLQTPGIEATRRVAVNPAKKLSHLGSEAQPEHVPKSPRGFEPSQIAYNRTLRHLPEEPLFRSELSAAFWLTRGNGLMQRVSHVREAKPALPSACRNWGLFL